MNTAAVDMTPDERGRAEEMLQRAALAFVALVEDVGQPGGARPYVVPMNFAYRPASPAETGPDGRPRRAGRLLLHTGLGRKTRALAGNPRVCVAVTADEVFEQGATPCQDGFAFRSVLLEGRALLLEDEDQREGALRAIVAKYDPAAAGRPFASDALAETVVYAVDVETLTYKQRPRHGAHGAAGA